MKFKFSLKNITISISVLIILAIAVLFIVLEILNRKPIAAFYGISERNRNSIVNILQRTHTRRNNRSALFEIKTLDDSLPLEEILKTGRKPDVLFIYRGANADFAMDFARKKGIGFEQIILNGMTSSVKKTVPVNNGKITGIPILIDNYEIDINISAFRSSGITEITSWQDIEMLAEKTKTSVSSPIIMPAGDDSSLINIMGALTESLSGIESWNSAQAKLRQTVSEGKTSPNDFYTVLARMIEKDGEFYEAASMLKRWQAAGLLSPNVFQMTMKDIKAYMNENLTAIVFMTLSEHRTVGQNTIIRYSSIYYPSGGGNIKRCLTAPEIFAIPLSKDKNATNAVRQFAAALQDSLSTGSGLAPVQAIAAVPDRQADDVRYWVASSDAPVPALSDAVFTDSSSRTACAQALRLLLKQ